MVATLITNGHRDCADYGIGFFKTALEAVYDERAERMRAVAIAVRASGAEEKDFRRFLDALDRDTKAEPAAKDSYEEMMELMEKYG